MESKGSVVDAAYHGIMPDTFKGEAEVVLKGKLTPAGFEVAPNGDAYTEFHISKPTGLPKGKYKVEVFLDSKSAGTKDFEVK